MRYSVEMTGAARERLEVPTTTSLERKLDVTSPRFPSDKPQIGPILRSSVLDQVRKFIPSLQAANKALERELEVRPASDLDIEHVDDDGAHIEMVSVGEAVHIAYHCGNMWVGAPRHLLAAAALSK
ncbi:uncharacterized protein HaLaN_08812, partial [Haematococcus lacustris]